MESDSHIPTASFVDTPQGIFTAAGVWFRTTKDELERYAGPVFEHESIERLIERSEVWLRSPQTAAVWGLPLFMLGIQPLPAALAALTIYVGWRSLSPSLVNRPLERVFELLDPVWLQGAFYVGILSYFAAVEQFGAVWTGLGGFILLRWGIVEKITDLMVRLIWSTLYAMPVNDQILRGFIIRAAMKYRVSLPQLDVLEKRVIEKFSKD